MSILDIFPKLKNKLDNNDKISVAICTPIYGNVANVDFFLCLMRTQKLLDSVKIENHFYHTKQESLVQRARNTLVAKALDNKSITHIFFIDSDIVWNENDVLSLLENDLEIVGGIYPKKSLNFEKILNTNEILNSKNTNEYNKNVSDENFLKHHLVNYNFNGYENSRIENGIIEVKHLATGFMMIKREVFDKMMIEHPEWEYLDDSHVPPLNMKFYSFFDCGIKNKQYLSEDWLFCERWCSMGGKVYADVIIQLTHIGTFFYEGRMLSILDIK